MHNSIHTAKESLNFTWQSTPGKYAKLKCRKISTLKNRETKMQYSTKYALNKKIQH